MRQGGNIDIDSHALEILNFPPSEAGEMHKRDTTSYTLSFEAPSVCHPASVSDTEKRTLSFDLDMASILALDRWEEWVKRKKRYSEVEN